MGKNDVPSLKGQPIVGFETSRAYDKTWQAMHSLVDKVQTEMIGPSPLQDPEVGEIAQKYSSTPAQVILCFMINRGVFMIPKSNNS
ncbi:MAG: hypothetical protein Q9170_007286 [Blastenia crenularia]